MGVTDRNETGSASNAGFRLGDPNPDRSSASVRGCARIGQGVLPVQRIGESPLGRRRVRSDWLPGLDSNQD